MSEEIMACSTCGCSCNPEDSTANVSSLVEEDAHTYGEETKFAVLIALVPAMTMTIFNLMGLI